MKKKRIYDRSPIKKEELTSSHFDAQPIQKIMAPPPFDLGSSSASVPSGPNASQPPSTENTESETSPMENSAFASSLSLGSPGPSSEKEMPGLGSETFQMKADGEESPKKSMPPWLKANLDEGDTFDESQMQDYKNTQLYVIPTDKKQNIPKSSYPVLDSFDPDTNEIISRKNRQLHRINPLALMVYLAEIKQKFKVGSKITPVKSNLTEANEDISEDDGKMPILRGKYILEVPEQEKKIPEMVLKRASRLGITIRDTTGAVHKLPEAF